jgi:hypothetical protein
MNTWTYFHYLLYFIPFGPQIGLSLVICLQGYQSFLKLDLVYCSVSQLNTSVLLLYSSDVWFLFGRIFMLLASLLKFTSYFSFLVILDVELRASQLLGKHSSTWAMPPTYQLGFSLLSLALWVLYKYCFEFLIREITNLPHWGQFLETYIVFHLECTSLFPHSPWIPVLIFVH